MLFNFWRSIIFQATNGLMTVDAWLTSSWAGMLLMHFSNKNTMIDSTTPEIIKMYFFFKTGKIDFNELIEWSFIEKKTTVINKCHIKYLQKNDKFKYLVSIYHLGSQNSKYHFCTIYLSAVLKQKQHIKGQFWILISPYNMKSFTFLMLGKLNRAFM